MTELQCQVCGVRLSPDESYEAATVRSNVRRFREERFELWRCPHCSSIHALHEVDLDAYYRGYPKFPEVDVTRHSAFGGQLRRMRGAGLRSEHCILDFGCGPGAFVRYLRAQGYEDAFGYDLYSERFGDPAVLDARYDCIVSQDVLEHVADPRQLLADFDRMTKPGGIVCIGTPEASAIDLRRPEAFVHALHAPYHRHILSARAVRRIAASLGWTLLRFYPTMYGNSLLPANNPRFGLHYLSCHDDCIDLLCEPLRLNSRRIWTPATLFYAFFGFFFDRHTDVTYVFRTREAAAGSPVQEPPGKGALAASPPPA